MTDNCIFSRSLGNSHKTGNSPHPPIIIFDFDGVLLDSRAHLLAARELLNDPRHKWVKDVKKRVTPMDILRRFEASDSPSIRQYLRNMTRNFEDILPHRFWRWIFFYRIAKRIRPYEYAYASLLPGVEDAIRILSEEKGALLGICSSAEGKRIRRWLDKTSLHKYIHCYNSRDSRKRVGLKPSPGPILNILVIMKRYYKLGRINRRKVLFVGDNVTDVLAAKNARVLSGAVLSGHGYYDELKKVHPDFIFESVAEIPQYFDEIF